jgi:hypothetical protein
VKLKLRIDWKKDMNFELHHTKGIVLVYKKKEKFFIAAGKSNLLT